MAPEVNNADFDQSEPLYANGINASTGEYLTPPISSENLVRYISGENPQKDYAYYDTLEGKTTQGQATYGLRYGIDCGKLEQTGWGVIYAPGVTDEMKEALEPLIDLRKAQAGSLFQEYAYQGETSRDFLIDQDTSIAGPAVPEEMPYYLLLVGSPEQIPFDFQYELDVDRAVGRINFFSAEEYSNYALSVVEAEKGQVRLPRRAGFFGVANPNDAATKLSTDLLVEPLYQDFKAKLETQELSWEVKKYLREDAKRAQLESLLGGDSDETPAFLFTTSHGVGFNLDDPRLFAHQGALLCQDWDRQPGSLEEDVYFAGEHIADDACLHGLIGFFFACYGAGTPREDEFSGKVEGQPRQIAPRSFLAGLPQRMLSHPRGGALAVIGHIERAWTYSFNWHGKPAAHRGVFEDTLGMLFDGYPIGAAFDFFNDRHASASVQLNALLEKKRRKIKVSDVDLVRMWTVNNDARDYIVLGDPAVRLCVPEMKEDQIRPSTIELKSVPMKPYRPGAVEVVQHEAPLIGSDAASAEERGTTITIDEEAEATGIDMDQSGKIVAASLREASRKLADMIDRTVTNLDTVEVLTYVCDDDLKNVYDREQNRFRDQAELKAVTLISLDGDVKSMIPARTVETFSEGKELTVTVEVDEKLLALHRDMVDLAQSNRAVFLRNLAEIATTLVNSRE